MYSFQSLTTGVAFLVGKASKAGSLETVVCNTLFTLAKKKCVGTAQHGTACFFSVNACFAVACHAESCRADPLVS